MGVFEEKTEEAEEKKRKKSSAGENTDRVSIHQRPAIVAERRQFGHWEGDSIVGLHHISGLHTEYERVSSFTRLEKIASRDIEKVIMLLKRFSNFETNSQNI